MSVTKFIKSNKACWKHLKLDCLVILLAGFALGFLMNQLLMQKKFFLVVPDSKCLPDDPENLFGHLGESQIANALAKRIRVVCMVLTMPSNHKTKAKAVKDTWATRCNAHFFVSSVEDPSLPSIAIHLNWRPSTPVLTLGDMQVKRVDSFTHLGRCDSAAGIIRKAAVTKKGDSRKALWNKTRFAVRYAYENYFDEFNYYLKADDDTFIVVENLRKLLSEHNPNELFIMGRRFRPYVKQGYLSGGGGYVFSKAALVRIHDGVLNSVHCAGRDHGESEDLHMGTCAEAVGVSVIDSLDAFGVERFHPFTPAYMMDKPALDGTPWFAKYNYHKITTGFECCSDYAVSFHYVPPSDMYVFHYFLYHLHPYGIHRDFMDLANLVCRTNSTPS